MTSSLSKYIRVMNIGFQNTFVYRWNFLLRALFSFIPLTGTFFLWSAFFGKSGGSIRGYGFPGMISYFLCLLLLDSLASPTEDDMQISGEIRDGLINQFLLKPMDYLAYRFSLFWSYRMIYTATTILPVLTALLVMRNYLALSGDVQVWFLALLSTLLSATLQFLIAYCSALLAFWILEVHAPIFILFSIEYLAGGHMFPLDLLKSFSPWVYRLAMCSPFAYEYWFPVGVFLERFKGPRLIEGFLVQAGWCLFFLGFARWLWSRGIRHYEAVGG